MNYKNIQGFYPIKNPGICRDFFIYNIPLCIYLIFITIYLQNKYTQTDVLIAQKNKN
ncbi:hypothetical protein NSB1T_12565 [Coprobacter fastidiosus NSB1 = JCM 33896]|nr:hypothetical protein NSB1T_12565 [Coprobacter fastidiosus NSB1 = JCM 33896]